VGLIYYESGGRIGVASYIDILKGKAFTTLSGIDYNRYREEKINAGKTSELYYEVSLLENKPWQYLRDRVYPAYARFLKTKKIDPESGEDVIVAVFLGKNCYLLSGEKFIDVYKEIEGLTRQAMRFRILKWLSE